MYRIEERIANCHGNLGALTHLFLKQAEALSVEAPIVYTGLESAVKDALNGQENRKKEARNFRNLFRSYVERKGCKVLENLEKIFMAEDEKNVFSFQTETTKEMAVA